MSASHAKEHIYIQRKESLFVLGKLRAFQGKLNPLSGSSIFVTCILPSLLYECEMWILDLSSIAKLERFQVGGFFKIYISPEKTSDLLSNGPQCLPMC